MTLTTCEPLEHENLLVVFISFLVCYIALIKLFLFRGDDLPKMGLLMVVLSLIFMSDHVITECKYVLGTVCNSLKFDIGQLCSQLFNLVRFAHTCTNNATLLWTKIVQGMLLAG